MVLDSEAVRAEFDPISSNNRMAPTQPHARSAINTENLRASVAIVFARQTKRGIHLHEQKPNSALLNHGAIFHSGPLSCL